MKSFLELKKTKKFAQKKKKPETGPNLPKLKKVTITFLAFCSFFRKYFFLYPDPDPGGKLNADPDLSEQESGAFVTDLFFLQSLIRIRLQSLCGCLVTLR